MKKLIRSIKTLRQDFERENYFNNMYPIQLYLNPPRYQARKSFEILFKKRDVFFSRFIELYLQISM